MGRPPDPNSLASKISDLHDLNPTWPATKIAEVLGVRRSQVAPVLTRFKNREALREIKRTARAAVTTALAKQKAKEAARQAVVKIDPIAPPETSTQSSALVTSEDEIDRIRTAVLDPEQRMSMIAEIAARGRDEVALRAMLAIQELQLRSGDISALPLPTSADDEDVRVSRMLEAVGRERAERAMLIAFAPKAAPSEAEASDALPSEAEDAVTQ